MIDQLKSRTKSRYWNESYHYEQWLINHDILTARECYSINDEMGCEYLIGLSGYVQTLRKRYKTNTVNSKVSRLIQCFRCKMTVTQLYMVRETVLIGACAAASDVHARPQASICILMLLQTDKQQ